MRNIYSRRRFFQFAAGPDRFEIERIVLRLEGEAKADLRERPVVAGEKLKIASYLRRLLPSRSPIHDPHPDQLSLSKEAGRNWPSIGV
jgi:hypothetical protein